MLSQLQYYIRYNMLGFIPDGKCRYVMLVLCVCFLLLFWRPISEGVSRTVGQVSFFSSLSSKLNALQNTLYWGMRYYSFSDNDEETYPVLRSKGAIDGFTREGMVLLRLYTEQGVIQRQSHLADLMVNDYTNTARYLNGFKEELVVIDYYVHEDQAIRQDKRTTYEVVIWLDSGVPLNESLVELGLATPMPTPPTNIVNKLMFTYYRGQLL